MADRDDVDRQAPPSVVAAVACGTVPVPFLAVYAVLFIVHGSVHPVVPPDITGSTRGELLCGIVAAVLFVVCSVALVLAMSGRRRWPFVLVQLLLFAAVLYFLIDGSKGGEFVSVLVLVVTAIALVLVLLPSSWRFYGSMHLPGRWQRDRESVPATASDTASDSSTRDTASDSSTGDAARTTESQA